MSPGTPFHVDKMCPSEIFLNTLLSLVFPSQIMRYSPSLLGNVPQNFPYLNVILHKQGLSTADISQMFAIILSPLSHKSD